MITNLPASELSKVFQEPIALFVSMASFESRGLTIAKELIGKSLRSVILRNAQVGPMADENFNELMRLGGERGAHLDLTLDSPLISASVLSQIPNLVAPDAKGVIFVDITTFTHEQLLILFAVFERAKPSRKVIFGYSGAAEYSTNTSAEDAWLSKGVGQVRSVLGFPGRFLPSRKLHLIVLVGFEYERARAVIEQFEPSSLTLGIGKKGESVADHHFENNRRFFEDVQNFVALRKSICSDVETFEFSCVDPDVASKEVAAVVERKNGYNTVICPLNTKLSTLGVALTATQNEDVQLCYARAIEYNMEGYSSPSDQVRIFEMNFGC
jgi:hypothetical protein